jgi:AraC family transcriptional regulator, ethanolamine operon transcriptional activator
MVQHLISAGCDSPRPMSSVLGGIDKAAYCDAEEQAAALTGWNQSYLQLSGGGFHGSMQRVNLGTVRLFMEELGSTVYQTGFLKDDVLALGVPLYCTGYGMFCGTPSGRDALHVFSGRSGFEFRTGSDHVMMGMELDPDVVSALYADSDHLNLRDKEAGIVATESGALDALRQTMFMLFETASTTPSLCDLPSLRLGMVDTLVEKIIALNIAPNNAEATHATHWHLVQASRHMVEDQLQQPPTVSELCSHLGVSRRTLQNAFQRVLGISPLSYLRAIRLGAARSALKTASSVTDAATALGFWHFGHFAKDYQTMFGELPSQTHRRYAPALQ